MTIKVSFSANPLEYPVYAEVSYSRGGVKTAQDFTGKTLRAVLMQIAAWWAEVEAA